MQQKYTSTKAACYLGYVMQALTINLPPLFFVIFQSSYAVSLTRLGQLVFLIFLVQFAMDILAIPLITKFGYRAAALLANGFAAVGMILFGFLPRLFPDPYVGILISVLCGSVGGGLAEVLVSELIDSIPCDAKASSMSLCHSFYAWGHCIVVLVTTVLLHFIGSDNWPLIPLLWSIIPAINLILFSRVPIPKVQREMSTKSALGNLMHSGMFFAFILLMLSAGASEQAMSQWSSLFVEKALGVSKIIGDLLGPCLFAVLMGCGRIFYGIFGKRIRILPMLFGCSVLTVFCYALTVFGGLPALSLIGCALCGLGVSLMWPAFLSHASSRFPFGGTASFALLALAGDFGCAVGPWLTGVVSDLTIRYLPASVPGTAAGIEQIGLKTGMLAASVFPIAIILILAVILLRERREAKAKN